MFHIYVKTTEGWKFVFQTTRVKEAEIYSARENFRVHRVN